MSGLINKRILIVNPGPVYPVRAMNQMRTHNMIKTLSREFGVDLLTPYINDEGYTASLKAMSETGGEFIPVRSVKHKSNIFKKRASQLMEYMAYYLWGTDREVTANKRHNNEIIKIIRTRGFKMVISNYWEGSLFFRSLGRDIYKILDPHYSVGENLELLSRIKESKIKYYFEKRRLRNNSRMEKRVINCSDLLLPLSKRNFEEFQKIAPEKEMLLIPDGADLDHFLSYQTDPDPETVLFYGSMGSIQNIGAFRRFHKNIFTELKNIFPGLKLLVVGSNPPEEIRSLEDGENITVTGFVEDVRPWLSKAWICVIPLELGSGFRGRVIELMAMGIPVIGTHNALDSIGLQSGREGFISDSDKELNSYCIKLLRYPELRNEMGSNSRIFVKEKYSIEITFGQLSRFLEKTKKSDIVKL